ncbi:putative hydrolase or acyltransferase of alpha/beta superfamily [Mycobacterium sp. JS623]|uniref:alpha/beta fold hydrolase n=1 Tax=Mycobacterium sp. JS623 TaxID=212767 RepID=UPI0002A5AE3F|nr:alpha/beta hydrolase [Mycobacterium sp. JS623]AGB25346.1 putative hydrolase or acyltransferase of alpha/beta superfamily [Mycobacterium sp. JS623]
MPSEPPPIPGARRSFVEARGVRFHVTESGPEDGRPVIALHGWPQHHWAYHHLLADPPPGLRIIAPDLPGFGWSGPAPHKWAKDDVASDVLALLDALALDKVLLVGHDWGAYAGYLMVLRVPERFDGYLALNMGYPWVTRRNFLAHGWPLLQYQPLMASFGVAAQRYTNFLYLVFKLGSALDRDTVRVYVDRFRDPVVARAGRDAYRTFLLREVPRAARHPEKRRATVPIRALYGVNDAAIHESWTSPQDAIADDFTLEKVDATHFIIDERPDLVRARLIALADETKP